MKQKNKSAFALSECNGIIDSIKITQAKQLRFISHSYKLLCMLILGIVALLLLFR